MADYYNFGIEIELISKPHTVRCPLVRVEYYERLAASLRKRNLLAQADTSTDNYHGSLGDPDHPQIPLEAVSPILSTRGKREGEIDTFWPAHKKVFHVPEQSIDCGSHVHVSPSGIKWSLAQLKNIAVGTVYFEALIHAMLPATRRHNSYCRKNSTSSSRLGSYISGGQQGWRNFMAAATGTNRETLIALMQSDRKVLWNFTHIVDDGIGTIEFRGGRGLRGERRSKWWIAFAVSYLNLLCTLKLHSNQGELNLSADELYKQIKQSARGLDMSSSLPASYQILHDSRETGVNSLPTCPSAVHHSDHTGPPPAYSSVYRDRISRRLRADANEMSQVFRRDVVAGVDPSIRMMIISLTLRSLQMLLGVVVGIIYSIHRPLPAACTFAQVLVGFSVITASTCALSSGRRRRFRSLWDLLKSRKWKLVALGWELVLALFWIAVGGRFAILYENQNNLMGHTAYLDLVNTCLWVLTAGIGTLRWLVGRKAEGGNTFAV
ncbi:hypothetical protein LTR95_010679 [Oleoguttula sp. CCFEE 5521]